jgi:mono/diheme cytochrome c family protein
MRVRTFAVVLVALFASATFLPAAQDKTKGMQGDSVYAELMKVPEKHRAKQNPLSKDPEATAAGEILFEQHCEECHGAHGVGGKKAPSLRAAEVQESSEGAIFYILSNGIVRKRMPVWSKLPEAQRWQLVSYIKSLGLMENRNEVKK